MNRHRRILSNSSHHTRIFLTRVFEGLFVVSAILIVPTTLLAETAKLIQTTTVDENALTFAAGPAARFASTVNGRSHQQTPLTTYRGYQYVTSVNARRRICLGRRKLPSGSWKVVQFKCFDAVTSSIELMWNTVAECPKQKRVGYRDFLPIESLGKGNDVDTRKRNATEFLEQVRRRLIAA